MSITFDPKKQSFILETRETSYQMMVDETELEVAGATKTVSSAYMTLDETTTTWAYVIFLGVIPALCLIIGAIVFIRRRFL